MVGRSLAILRTLKLSDPLGSPTSLTPLLLTSSYAEMWSVPACFGV